MPETSSSNRRERAVPAERSGDVLLPSVVVGLLAALILVPKLGGVHSVNDFLWGDIHGIGWFEVIAQDLLLVWIVAGVTLATLRTKAWPLFLGWWVVVFAIVWLLIIDMRVRVMWLKPLDYEQAHYFFAELASIRSSVGTFFDGPTMLGISCRRLFFGMGVVFVVTFALAVLDRRRNLGVALVRWHARGLSYAWLGLAALGLLVCSRMPRQLYSLEDTLFVRAAVRLLEPQPARASVRRFEQPPRPMRDVLAPPRVRLVDAAPLSNVVLVVLESFRFKGHDWPSSALAPNLSRLARDGLWAKAYVAVPHSSKGLYASLTGRYPSSCVEIHEAKHTVIPSVFGDLLHHRHASTTTFSAQYLRFENTEGLLEAAGIEHAYGPEHLERLTRNGHVHFSYGTDDVALTDVPVRVIAEAGRRPFATILLTINAHHPYVYPSKEVLENDEWSEYERAIQYTDAVLGDIVRSFDAAGLADDTLFVFVGDHGESFGEHGVRLHNNSLYEEEITVPLVFWTKDGRLRHGEGLEARQIDIAPTISDLLGLRDVATPTQGVSLLRSATRPPAFVATFFDGVEQALVLDGTKYIYFPSSGRLTRFDLAQDPDERSPIVVTGEEERDIRARLVAAEAFEASQWSGHD